MAISKLGRYEFDVDDELGQGGMATVFLARDPYMKRQVAIKVLSYKLVSDELFEEYFKREAKIIAGLEHPHIVPVFDVGQQGAQPYIVMRYMSGGTLQDRLNQGKLERGQLARIISRVADGLDAAHAKGIIHRDVKPSNILFDSSNEAFLSDFGLAQTLRQSTSESGTLFVGTPGYMSPEQVRDQELDGRSDVYSLGVVIYRVLTGQLPFDKGSSVATARAHLTEPTPNILEVKTDLQSMWQDIINRALAKNPTDRYATVTEMADDVREVDSGRWFMRKLADF